MTDSSYSNMLRRLLSLRVCYPSSSASASRHPPLTSNPKQMQQ